MTRSDLFHQLWSKLDEVCRQKLAGPLQDQLHGVLRSQLRNHFNYLLSKELQNEP
jgi:hypothetical protein